MAAVVVASPSSVPVNGFTSVSGTGGSSAKNRLKLDGVVVWAGCDDTGFDGAAVQVGAVPATQTIDWEQLLAGVWTSVDTTPVEVTATGTGSALTYTARPNTAPWTSLPTYLTPFSDPTWGTTGVRISNVASRRHFYSRFPAWNSDGTKLLMFQFTGGAGRMINGTTYADIGSFSPLSGLVMCNTDPNKGYGVDGGGSDILYTQNLTTAAITTKHTFTGYSALSIGGDTSSWEGGISDDDRYICISLIGGSGDRLIVYDTVGDTIVGNIAKPAGMDNAQISRLGNYVVVVGSFGTRRYPRDLSSFITISAATGHGDNALDSTGREIYVAVNAPGVVSYDLVAGANRLLLPAGSAYEYGHAGGHGPAGWVTLSEYDSIATAGRLGWDQVVKLKTDGSGDVVVYGFANHRTNGSVYAQQPHASPSKDGTKVVVASEWGATDAFDYVFSL